MKLTKEKIKAALENRSWDLGNKALYDLCSLYPHHKNDQEIIGKVWLIGRAYATAIERRKNKPKDLVGDLFYENKVVSAMQASGIDAWLTSLKRNPTPDLAVQIHSDLTDRFFQLTGLKKGLWHQNIFTFISGICFSSTTLGRWWQFVR